MRRRDFEDFTRVRSDKEVLKRLVDYGKPHKKTIVVALILMVFNVIIDVLPPAMMGYLIHVLSTDKIEASKKPYHLLGIVVIFLLSMIFGNIFSYKQSMMLQEMGQDIVLRLRFEVFDHIENLSIGQINQIPVGTLVTRVTNDTNSISEMYTSVLVNLFKNALYLIITGILLLIINWKLALIVFAFVPLVYISSRLFRNFSRRAYRRVRGDISELNAFLSENLSGIKVTQIFNQQEKKREEFEVKTGNLFKNHFRELTTFALYRPSVFFFSMTAGILIFYFGFKEYMAHEWFTGALLYTFYTYVRNFFEPIQDLAEQYNIIQNAFASAEKVFDVLDTKPEIIDEEDSIELEEFSGNIEFNNVWFHYIEDEWVLKDISFKVNSGETIAFVGATGSGKSTILNLIVRNYEIQKGEILIDGIDIHKIKRSSLRKHIGQMLQDVFLFSGTITENITLNDEKITFEEVVEAAEYVGADSFIENLDGGYDHKVLERGNNFSTGQRQLLSFARVLVYKPSLMILDEATANIDSESESLIQDSLTKMMSLSTMIIVAHRLSTIQHSDKILVLSKGEIKEQGNHQELLAQKGIYYHLYEIQKEEREIV